MVNTKFNKIIFSLFVILQLGSAGLANSATYTKPINGSNAHKP
jgi:hypothetical protein